MKSLLADAHVADDGRRGDRARGRLDPRRGRLRRSGRRGEAPEADERIELGGAVVTPGLVNTHHHLYQTLTRARAQQATLFEWLVELYPTWARIDAEAEYAAARTGHRRADALRAARPSSTTTTSSRAAAPGSSRRRCRPRAELGCRLVASRGSMDLGVSDGGLPPDELVEEIDAVLADTERLVGELHETGPGARIQIAVAPCSPFSVTGRLMTESAELARRLGLQLHTHLAETVEEEAYCQELYGCTPVEYLDSLGWLDGDVWCAHCVHLSAGRDRALRRDGDRRRPLPDLEPPARRRRRAGAGDVDAGVRVGLGVDGSASNERSHLFNEVKQALLVARGRGGPRRR